MVDEFFRDMDDFASSDIIYSMREQMTPSDEVVSSLLAKIAECDASPERFENSVPFEAVVKKSPGRKPLVKYATCWFLLSLYSETAVRPTSVI